VGIRQDGGPHQAAQAGAVHQEGHSIAPETGPVQQTGRGGAAAAVIGADAQGELHHHQPAECGQCAAWPAHAHQADPQGSLAHQGRSAPPTHLRRGEDEGFAQRQAAGAEGGARQEGGPRAEAQGAGGAQPEAPRGRPLALQVEDERAAQGVRHHRAGGAYKVSMSLYKNGDLKSFKSWVCSLLLILVPAS